MDAFHPTPPSTPSGGHTDPLARFTPWTLWAKWSPVSQQPNSYHPLLCHLLDVASCAEAMWRHALPDHWKRRMSEELGLNDLPTTERWVIFWAALHDLGKACPGFQLQLQHPQVQTLLTTRLTDAGLPASPAPWVGHGDVSAYALRSLLSDLFGLSRPAALEIALAVGGHHGRFPTPEDLMRLPSASLGGAPWDSARLRITRWLADELDIPTQPPMQTPHSAAMALAGFVSVVDWIGSSEVFFHHAAQDAHTIPSLDPAAYLTDSRRHADEALESLGWTGWTPSTTTSLSFSALFPGKSPRPLQETVIALAETLDQSPQPDASAIVIIEAPMGEGKTEAAMYLADHWTSRYGQRGIYFALPSQASSDQMFDRITAFLSQRYPHDTVNAQLLHGHAALSATLRELRDRGRAFLAPDHIYTTPNDENGSHGAAEGAVIAAEWFASAKRSLLAPFGVGTIDQALLASLQTLHVFVRVYGLSTKTIIVDEVHAYDTYMLTLLCRLMEWLGALHVPVILLSATLPSSRRQTLLTAYARGAGWAASDSLDTASVAPIPTSPASSPSSVESPASLSPTPYPRVSWANSASSGAYPIPATAARRQRVTVEWSATTQDAHDPSASPLSPQLLDHFSDLLAQGGCAAIICNTVARAQQVYLALKPLFPGLASDGAPQLDLLHARFPLEERGQREERALRRFGRPGPDTTRPDRAILVSTQIIEQSLDLDFDLMLTDLAPGDLVLQRMGRMHRHGRPRPPLLQQPRLIILAGATDAQGVPIFDSGSEHVYDPHILLRSWLTLQRYPTLTLPDDIEPLVEAIYAENATLPADASPALRAHWDTTLAKQRQAIAEDEQQAKQRYIGAPWSDGLLSAVAPFLRDEDAPELHPAFQALTRLTEQNVTIACFGGDEQAPRLRPGGPPINLQIAPTIATTEAFLKRSLNLTDRRVVFQLLEREIPAAWRKSALLRRLHPLYFGPDGAATVGHMRLLLDPDLGLRIEPLQSSERAGP